MKKKDLIDGINPKEIIIEGTVGCTLNEQEWKGLKKGDKVTIKGDLWG